MFYIVGCKKFIEVSGPPTSINISNVYSNDASAIAVLNGIYSSMSKQMVTDGNSLNSFMSLYPGLSADEFTINNNANNNLINYYKNQLTNMSGPNIWESTYPYIYVINSAIEGLQQSGSLTPSIKQHLLGEAKFLRAFCYFYLVNLYGDVPYAETSDYKVNSSLSRLSRTTVYQKITSDLKEAEQLLSQDYLDIDGATVTTERTVPTKWAAIALLARTYLYIYDYRNAELEASKIINNISLYSLSNLNSVFLKNSLEAIWQLQPVNVGWNTEDAKIFILPETGPSNTWPVYLSDNLISVFELGDLRRSNWIDSVRIGNSIYYYPFKYKSATQNAVVTEYQMVLRLGEQYLIRAEARINMGNIDGAISDVNSIRHRAGLIDYGGELSKESIINEIIHERQVELFAEWGHRWLDLKRTGRIDEVMKLVAVVKGSTWNTNDQWYPILMSELSKNSNLVQNIGY